MVVDSRAVISFSWIAFSSKNLMLNLYRFSCGMGFIIMVVKSGGDCVTLVIRVLGVMFRIIGKWS